MIDKQTEQNLRFIIDLIDRQYIDEYIFNNYVDFGLKIIRLPVGTISLEMLEDIKSDPEHYRKFI